MNRPQPRDERYLHRPPNAAEMDVDRLASALMSVIDQCALAQLSPSQRFDDQAIAAARTVALKAALGRPSTSGPRAGSQPRRARRRGPNLDPQLHRRLAAQAACGQRLRELNQRRADADPAAVFAAVWTAYAAAPMTMLAFGREQMQLACRAGLVPGFEP